MTTPTSSTESKTDSSNTGYDETEVKKEVNTEPEVKKDEFGYDIIEEEKKPEEKKEEVKKEDEKTEEDEEVKKEDEKTEEDEEVKNPSTGYDDDKEDDKKPEDKKSEEKTEKTEEEIKVDADKLKTDITEVLKDLPEGYDKEKALKFATDNKFTVEQIKAYTEMEKAASADYNTNQEEAKKTQKKEYIADLKDDAVFGGENFAKNVNRVEKLLDKHMPHMKKTLTDRGGMMPPYLMKDLLALDKMLNPTTSLVTGDPVPAPKKEENFLDTMYE